MGLSVALKGCFPNALLNRCMPVTHSRQMHAQPKKYYWSCPSEAYRSSYSDPGLLQQCGVYFTVIASHHQRFRGYPNGGGDYAVASRNLGSRRGVFVGDHNVWFAVGIVILIILMNLRSVKQSGGFFAVLTSILGALTVHVDDHESQPLKEALSQRTIPVTPRILVSPCREVIKTSTDYVTAIRFVSTHDVMAVLVPQYVVGHWWEQLLHNQSALRPKSSLGNVFENEAQRDS